MTTTAGERFAQAVAAKDAAALRALLADPVSFTALTPGRPWQSASAGEVIDEIILGRWFAGALAMELESVSTGRVADCQHVGYRLGVRTADGDYLVEQQAYYGTEDQRIAWMRVLCSGYQPVRKPEDPVQELATTSWDFSTALGTVPARRAPRLPDTEKDLERAEQQPRSRSSARRPARSPARSG